MCDFCDVLVAFEGCTLKPTSVPANAVLCLAGYLRKAKAYPISATNPE